MSNDIVSILVSQGMSLADIADMFGVSVHELETSCNCIASEALEEEVVQEQHVEGIQASKREEAAKLQAMRDELQAKARAFTMFVEYGKQGMVDVDLLPESARELIARHKAQEANAKAFSQWLDTLCIILADNAQEWLELNTLAIECRTFSTLGSAESGKAYQLCRKKRAYYAKQLDKEQQSVALQQTNDNTTQPKLELWEYYSYDSEDVSELEECQLTPYAVWFAMCEELLHSALDARFFESLAQAEIISERAYKGSKCKYHLDLSGQAKSDYKRVIHNTGVNASAYDHKPTDEAVPVRQPPKIVRKLSKLK